MSDLNRRAVLQLVGVAGGIGLAGCTQSSSDVPTDANGGSSPSPRDGRSPTTSRSTPTPPDRFGNTLTEHHQWFPAPSTIGNERHDYNVSAAAVEPLLRVEDKLGLSKSPEWQSDEPFPVPGFDDWTNVQMFIQFGDSFDGLGTVISTPFDRTAIEQAFEDTDSDYENHHDETARQYQGYSLYTGSGSVVAVGDEFLIASGVFMGDASTDTVQTLIDTWQGANERAVDVDPDLARLVEEIGDTHYFATEMEPPLPDSTIGGVGYHVGSERTDARIAVVFEDDTFDEGIFDVWLQDDYIIEIMLGGQQPEVSTDGRVGTLSATAPTGEINRFVDDLPTPPNPQFAFYYEETGTDQGILRITLGDPELDPSGILILGTGFADVEGADQTQPGKWNGELTANYLLEGDSTRVGVRSDHVIRVAWGTTETNETIQEHRGPDAPDSDS